MPLVELQIEPGMLTEQTERGSRGVWRNGNLVRFRQGLAEKFGGWQVNTPAGDPILGIPRAALDWQAIDHDRIMAIGTNKHLYQQHGGVVTNITPLRLATDAFGGTDPELTNPFDTTSGSAIVNVSHTGHGLVAGTTIYFDGATAVGGLTIDGGYEVVEVLGNDDYTIDAGSNASSTANGGGTVDYAYEINIGGETAAIGLGWGAGPFGEGTWGTAREVSSHLFHPRTWALDTWGEDLIANPRGGGIYIWDKSGGYTSGNTAVLIDPSAPSECTFIVMSPVDRHLIALGCTPVGGSALDPLVIRWCSQNDYTDWVSTRTNTAGERRIDGASEILSGLRTREEILIWTDVSLYSLTYVGPPATFNLRQVATNCGLVGPLARASYGGVVFWMSYEDFFYYDGTLGVVPCSIRNHVFEDRNKDSVNQFFAAVNTPFQEIMFFYCSAASQEIDRYALLNVQERHWTFGELERTAWLDQAGERIVPGGFDSTGTFYDHETGTTANGEPMGEFLETWDFELPGGEEIVVGDQLLFLRRLVPDFLTMTGPMQITLEARKYPAGQQVTRGPFSMTSADQFLRPRIRGRQVSLRMESDQSHPETYWRAGTWRLDVRPHGRR